jgi:hypothetical protein
MAFSAIEGSFEDATHGRADNQARLDGKLVPAPYTSPPFYELGVFQTPAGLHGKCTSARWKDCQYEPPGYDPKGSSQWFRGCAKFRLNPKDWRDPTTQVRVGLWDLEENARRVREHPKLRDLFDRARRGSDWDLLVAVLMGFAGGPGWAGRWLVAERNRLMPLPETQRWEVLRNAIRTRGKRRDAHLLTNVERKFALAAQLDDADLLASR